MKRFIFLIFAITLSLQLTACHDYVNTDYLDSDFNTYLSNLKSEWIQGKYFDSKERYVSGALLKLHIQKIKKTINHFPNLEGRITANPQETVLWIQKNNQKIIEWHHEIAESAKDVRSLIYDISENAYENKGSEKGARDSVLVYFGLHYYRELQQSLVEIALPVLLVLGSETFQGVEKIEQFKKLLLNRYFEQVGLSFVIHEDLFKVAQELKLYLENSLIPTDLNEILSNTYKKFVYSKKEDSESLSQTFSQLSEKDLIEVNHTIQKFKQEFSKISLLYQPQSDQAALLEFFGILGGIGVLSLSQLNRRTFLDSLVVLGNLTWGLVNTLAGAGIILATAIASPFTDRIDFPTFQLAKNGKQIYVDVSGMYLLSGKMSLGLWELSNGYGWSAVSEHEGGHATQSAVLGPLYIPVVLVSYASVQSQGGFVEDWADIWAY
ncbi:MAG: hypothetical protein HYW47_00455 [Deltaproteobacteria bacterium]|nr:hypothetical protein [Deltaproteobacteria bacterium]